jgi:hypothetical protein
MSFLPLKLTVCYYETLEVNLCVFSELLSDADFSNNIFKPPGVELLLFNKFSYGFELLPESKFLIEPYLALAPYTDKAPFVLTSTISELAGSF